MRLRLPPGMLLGEWDAVPIMACGPQTQLVHVLWVPIPPDAAGV